MNDQEMQKPTRKERNASDEGLSPIKFDHLGSNRPAPPPSKPSEPTQRTDWGLSVIHDEVPTRHSHSVSPLPSYTNAVGGQYKSTFPWIDVLTVFAWLELIGGLLLALFLLFRKPIVTNVFEVRYEFGFNPDNLILAVAFALSGVMIFALFRVIAFTAESVTMILQRLSQK